MAKTIAVLITLFIGALLAFAAIKPDTFKVQRHIDIHAGIDKIHPLINNLHRFNTWNPYNKKDPAMQGRYEGPESGPGATFHFQGNKDVGKGNIAITATQPDKVTMQLTMLEPMEGRNTVEFILQPQGQQTHVTWAMHGPNPFIAKLAGIFFNMDQMIGRDFEAGLTDLKKLAESQ